MDRLRPWRSIRRGRTGSPQAPTAPSSWQRGATIIEYALVVAVLVVGAVASTEFLTEEATNEINNQADCVSSRPPPPSCQLSPIITTTSVSVNPSDPSSTPDSVPDGCPPDQQPCPSTTTSTTTPPSTTPPVNVAWGPGGPSVSGNASAWSIALQVDASSGGAPAAGVTIRVDFQITQPTPQPAQTVTCTTDASGSCTVTYSVPFNNVTQVQVRYRGSTPAGGSVPGQEWCVPAPGAAACP